MTESAGVREPVTYLRLDMFADRLGDVFRVEPADGQSLELVLVVALGRTSERAAEDRPQSFSLEFRGPNEPILPQQIYRLQHSELGDLDIFLVPIGPDEQGLLYEAIFNYDA